MNPERGPEAPRERGEAAQNVGTLAVGNLIDPESRKALHDLLDETLDQANLDPSKLKGFRISRREVINKDGRDKLHTLSFMAEQKPPEWPVVQRATSIIRPLPASKERKVREDGHKLAMIFPDTQIGYRFYSNGEVDPFHDNEAISVALQIMRDTRPDKVVFLGDFLDLPEQSKYAQEPEFAGTTQMSIDYGHALLGVVRATLPKAEIVVLEGNHDKRLADWTKKNAMAAYGVKRAGEDWPALSLPYLLALDQLGVEYVGGYPAGRYYITPQLQAIHGRTVRSGGSTAKAVTGTEAVSTIFGHVHRIESSFSTTDGPNGGITVGAFSPGTLSRIDGAIPSYKGGVETDGRPVRSFENWQQGCAIVEYDESGRFTYNQVHIDTFNDYQTRYAGKTYKPDQSLIPQIWRR